MNTYLVTGPTGNVGSQVISQLLERGEKVRVLTRDQAKVASWGDRVEIAIGDYGKPETFTPAFAGVAGAFLMNAAPDADAFRQIVAAARSQGSPRLVFLSTILAGKPDSAIGQLHKEKEDLIRESGLPGKFLRAGGFMTNALQWAGPIKAEGVVYNPMGQGRYAPIAAEDIAAVAVRALTDPTLAGEVLELTGGERLSLPDQVNLLSEVLGKPLSCVEISTETAVQNLIRAGVPAPVATAVGQSFETIREGRAPEMNDTVERVTGRAPMTFLQWAQKHAARFA